MHLSVVPFQLLGEDGELDMANLLAHQPPTIEVFNAHSGLAKQFGHLAVPRDVAVVVLHATPTQESGRDDGEDKGQELPSEVRHKVFQIRRR